MSTGSFRAKFVTAGTALTKQKTNPSRNDEETCRADCKVGLISLVRVDLVIGALSA